MNTAPAGTFLLALVVIISMTVSVGASERQEQLKQLQQEIARKTEKLTQVKKREMNATQKVQRSEAMSKALKEKIQSSRSEQAALRQSIDRKEQEAGREKSDYERRHQEMTRRILGLYRAQSASPSADRPYIIKYLPDGTGDTFTRIVLDRERALLDGNRSRLAKLKERVGILKQKKCTSEQETKQSKSALAKTEREKAGESAALRQIQVERKQLAQSLKEMARRKKRLQSLIARLQQADHRRDTREAVSGKQYRLRTRTGPSASGPMPSWFGRFSLPVHGTIIRRFGLYRDPRYQTSTFSNGITIQAPAESDIRAIAPGKIIFADSFKGYGKLLILDHGEQIYSLYAFCASLGRGVGESVARGEVIGRSGALEHQEGTGLYFELRRKGKPLDPMRWL